MTPEQLEIRNKRRQRNRECAQRSRERKNHQIYELQTKIKELEAEIKVFRANTIECVCVQRSRKSENVHLNELKTKIQELETKNQDLEDKMKMTNTFHKIQMSVISARMYGLKWLG